SVRCTSRAWERICVEKATPRPKAADLHHDGLPAWSPTMRPPCVELTVRADIGLPCSKARLGSRDPCRRPAPSLTLHPLHSVCLKRPRRPPYFYGNRSTGGPELAFLRRRGSAYSFIDALRRRWNLPWDARRRCRGSRGGRTARGRTTTPEPMMPKHTYTAFSVPRAMTVAAGLLFATAAAHAGAGD